MVYLTDKDTKHIKDQSTDTEEYLEYTKEKGKNKDTNLGNERDQHNSSGNYNNLIT